MTPQEETRFVHNFVAAYLAKWYAFEEARCQLDGNFERLKDPPLEDAQYGAHLMVEKYSEFLKKTQ